MDPRFTTRKLPVLVLITMLCLLAGCSQPWVIVGYDHAPPAPAARTYSIAVLQLAVAQYAPALRADVEKEMAHRGWQLVPSGGADTMFVLGDVHDAAALGAFYTKYGNGWQPAAWGQAGRGAGWAKSSYGELDSVALGNPGNKLVIDLFDSGSHQLLLRAVALNDYSRTAKKNTKVLGKTIHRMLKDVPK